MILLLVLLLVCLIYMTHRACSTEKRLLDEIDRLKERNYEQARIIIKLRGGSYKVDC